MNKERGVALISVLFIVCIVSILIASMLSREELDSKRTSNALNQAQAAEYAKGAYELARQVLMGDLQANPDLITRTQPWATLQNGFDIADGHIDIQIEDMQGRFNLNSLIGNSRNAVGRLQTLCQILGIAPASAQRLAAFIVTKKGLIELSELRDNDTLSAEELNLLKQYVSVLPDTLPNINVNTANKIVLQSYLDSGQSDFLTTALQNNTAINSEQLAALALQKPELTTKSSYFRVSVTVHYAGRTSRSESLLHYLKEGNTPSLNRIYYTLSPL